MLEGAGAEVEAMEGAEVVPEGAEGVEGEELEGCEEGEVAAVEV